MDYFKIDEVAKQTGLTKRTIRYYEEIGILPVPQRTDGGTRVFTQSDIDLLKKVVDAKEVLGFTLHELQKYLTMSDVLENKKVVYRNASNGKDQKEKLTQIVQVINDQLDLIDVKLIKIQAVKQELEELRSRADKKISQLGEEQS